MKKLAILSFLLALPTVGTMTARANEGQSGSRGSLPGVQDRVRTSSQSGAQTGAQSAANTSENQSITYRVSDLECVGCETRVQNAVRKVPGVRSVQTNAQTGQVSFTVEGRNKIDETAVVRAIESEGFRVIR